MLHLHGLSITERVGLEVVPNADNLHYLDFASPVSGLGGKMGLDATNKWPGETAREWGRAITMDAAVRQRVASLVAGLLPG